MKNHFFFPYVGNKRQEVEHIYSKINFENIDTICEPFCGSCAVSYYIWSRFKSSAASSANQNPDKKFKYVINDTDKLLCELLTLVKSDNKERMEEIEIDLNEAIRRRRGGADPPMKMK